MAKKISYRHFHWGVLFFGVGIAFGSIISLGINAHSQFLIALSFAVFYFLWGVLHYFALRHKHRHILYEYLSLSVLIIVIAYLMFISR